MTTGDSGSQPDEDEPAVEVEDFTVPGSAAGVEVLYDGDEDEEDDDEEDDDGPFGSGWSGLGDLMAQAQDMQARLLASRAALEETIVEGQAGGGVVRVVTTGGFEFRDVRIDPAAVDPADTEMLQDLVLAAIRDAVAKVNELNAAALGGLGGSLGGLLP
ncbi:MAG TPA: YbaB/EbfC family nucleoid-associated protein [Acidimicrobiales bacterium]|nr:YbaB/EbfC family nucleoid-associated protein [Acidimicrobiales bacterium]